MKLFLDTNVLIDVIARREPFAKWALLLFKEAKLGTFELYTSTFSISTTFYLMEKQVGKKKSKRVIGILLNRIRTKDVDHRALRSALASTFSDFEDAVQYECAKQIKDVSYLVTRNKKDFKPSHIKVCSPEELFI